MKAKLSLLAIFAIAALAAAFAQGPLTPPPGAPAPAMKTLDQIEPRQEVNATNTPGNGTNVFVISASGSYYLGGNVTGVNAKNGIKNSASGNTTNWDVVAGNVILVVNAVAAGAVTGNSGGTAPGSTDPSANFTY